MALVVPPPGELKETARLLLRLAGDVPEIVRTVSAGNAFDVPDELADLYHEALNGPRSDSASSRRRPARSKKE